MTRRTVRGRAMKEDAIKGLSCVVRKDATFSLGDVQSGTIALTGDILGRSRGLTRLASVSASASG